MPSVHRELSRLGRMAFNGGCEVTITCVLDTSLGADSKKIRDRRCSAARAAMGMFESRGKIRSGITKEYSLVKVDPSQGWSAGAVYVTLQ